MRCVPANFLSGILALCSSASPNSSQAGGPIPRFTTVGFTAFTRIYTDRQTQTQSHIQTDRQTQTYTCTDTHTCGCKEEVYYCCSERLGLAALTSQSRLGLGIIHL